MTAPTCVRCGKPTADGYLCVAETARAAGQLAEIGRLVEDARMVAYGLSGRTEGSGGSRKPGSRSPGNDDALDALDDVHDQLARTCIHIAIRRGVTYTVPCLPSCIQPSPSQAHCATCHETFGGVTGFDRHRRDGQCLTPDEIGYTADHNGVWRAPMTEAGKARLAALREPQMAENGSGVPAYTPDVPTVPEAISAGGV